MEFKPTATRTKAPAFTLIEVIISVCLATLVLLGGVSVYVFSLSSFLSMSNYADMNSKTRHASDLISRDIRSAMAVDGTTTSNTLVLNAQDGVNVTYAYDQLAGQLVRSKGSETVSLLTGIDWLNFSLYQRPTNRAMAFELLPPANPADAKLIAFQWSCSRPASVGQTNRQPLQAALVELRNQ